MTGLPTPYRLLVRERQIVGQDGYGNDVTEWVEAEWMVYGIAPGSMDDPPKENREPSIVQWTVYGPKVGGYPRSTHSEIKLPGGGPWYQVIGDPDDWTMGPWKHPTAGLTVALEKVDG